MRAIDGQEEAVREVLLSNLQRIRSGERGNRAFAAHRSLDDARQFWLYETRTDLEAVTAHESGADVKAHKDRLRPLVEPDSVLFGNTEPLAALGYSLTRGD